MANPFAGYMTVRQVMDAIGARAPSTVTRLVYDEDKPRPAGKSLAGTLIQGHGWMIQKKSVDKLIEDECRRPKGVGFPRGHVRESASAGTGRPRKRRARPGRAAKKPPKDS